MLTLFFFRGRLTLTLFCFLRHGTRYLTLLGLNSLYLDFTELYIYLSLFLNKANLLTTSHLYHVRVRVHLAIAIRIEVYELCLKSALDTNNTYSFLLHCFLFFLRVSHSQFRLPEWRKGIFAFYFSVKRHDKGVCTQACTLRSGQLETFRPDQILEVSPTKFNRLFSMVV